VIGPRYSRLMRHRGPGGRTIGAVVVLGMVAVAGCGSGSGGDTLSPIGGSAGTTPSVATPSGSGATAGTAVDPASAGAGFVQVQVQIAVSGVDETLSLDRATVDKTSLDPVSLDAACTPLDNGDTSKGVDVSVVDLRRLGAGNQLVSATLHVAGPASAGDHDATLQLAGADQVTTNYAGTVALADGGWAGTFQMTDKAGNALTGSFACAAEPLATTTTVPDSGGNEAVPDTPAPTTPTNT
jgi:hypothetical protein